MSNTGHKGITDMREWGVPHFRVAVQWKGKNTQKYLRIEVERFEDRLDGGYGRCLKEAIALRDEMEKQVGKPRTERHLRWNGVMAQRLGQAIRLLPWSR